MNVVTRTKYVFVTLIAVLSLGFDVNSEAATYLYSGAVTDGTPALLGLLPIGTPASGFLIFNDVAVATGFAGEADLSDYAINIGGFCIYLVTPDCNNTEFPTTTINEVAVSFDNDGNVSGGIIDIEFLSPSDPWISWVFDFDADTFTITDLGSNLGFSTGEAQIFRAVPVPAAVWFFGSALFALIRWSRPTI